MRTRTLVLLLVLAAAAPPLASATTACTPSAAVDACATHSPYQGSLYCEKAWSSGGGSNSLLVEHPSGIVWLHVGYWCFNYSNYGENPYQSNDVTLGASAAGQNVWLLFGSYYETYYTDQGGPYYRDGCYVGYNLYGPVDALQFVDCPYVPAPWGTLLTPLFQSYVSVNADCTSGSAPTAQVCWRGSPTAQVLGVSACTGASTFRARALGTTLDSPQAGAAGCLVFREVLG